MTQTAREKKTAKTVKTAKEGEAAKSVWTKADILCRLKRIADEAKDATWCEKKEKSGELTREYDARCASIELKAVEYAVKLSGFLEEEREQGEIRVILSEESRHFAI